MDIYLAISDDACGVNVKACRTEIAACRHIAQLLFQDDDLDRANGYLVDDATKDDLAAFWVLVENGKNSEDGYSVEKQTI